MLRIEINRNFLPIGSSSSIDYVMSVPLLVVIPNVFVIRTLLIAKV